MSWSNSQAKVVLWAELCCASTAVHTQFKVNELARRGQHLGCVWEMLPRQAPFKELVNVLETMYVRLHGDLVRVHQNMILDEMESHFVHVLLTGVQV